MKRIGDLEAYDGMKAKFTACCSGYPEPSVEWFKDGQKIFGSDRVKLDIESHGLLRLSIDNANRSDIGQYKCRIFNPHGEDSCTADLIFEGMILILFYYIKVFL